MEYINIDERKECKTMVWREIRKGERDCETDRKNTLFSSPRNHAVNGGVSFLINVF